MRSFPTKTLLIIQLMICTHCIFASTPNFTKAEKEWLENHPTLVFAVDNNYPPLNFMSKNGEMKGLNIDILNLIEENLGIEIVLKGSSWEEALTKAMNHEVDGILNSTSNPAREEKLNFTRDIIFNPIAITTLKSHKSIKNFSQLRDLKVAVRKGSSNLHLLKQKISEENIIEFTNLFEAIDLIYKGEVAAIYENLAPIYYLITENNIPNLKIAFIEHDIGASAIGLRNNDLLMLSIINKAIDAIPQKEITNIQESWIRIDSKNHSVYYIIIITILIIAIIILVWNRILNILVQKKTLQLTTELEVRKKVEKELADAKRKAEENEKEKSAFLANISHEIRTPINTISGFSDLLAREEHTPDIRKKYTNIILNSSNQLMNLVTDLLYFSKIEANQETVKREIVHINKLLDEIFHEFQILIQQKNIELLYQKNLSLNLFAIETDATKLKQIIHNLLGNAIKFTHRGYIKYGCKIVNDNLEFHVEDTGIGIPAEMLDEIFERFSTIKTNLDNNHAGSGLGLSISKKLVKLLNGEIRVSSIQGKGSSFYFTIPLIKKEICNKEKQKPLSVTYPQIPNGYRPTILIVEDEIANYIFTKEIVERMGFNHLHAKNGKEAIRMCSSENNILLVLMDIRMPVMDGYEATRRIKALWPELSIIALTAFSFSTDMKKVREAGFDDFLEKPLNKEKLYNKLSSYMIMNDITV